MSQKTADEIRTAVSAAYGARARQVAAGEAASCCHSDCCSETSETTGAREQFYTANDTAGLPETAVSYGCGNPVAIGALQPGEVVLDLGSGAGLDCFLAAKQVGPDGQVIGLDMTDDMLALAEINRAKVGATNVEFRKGLLEAMPVAGSSVDAIISNCVINLSPDKNAVFREALRVLKPGGRLHVSDVVLLHELSAVEQNDLDLWAGCISGALTQDDYDRRLRAAGFTDVTIQLSEESDNPWRSALIDAYRPGGESRRPIPAAGNETIELIAVPGLQTAACCGPEAGSGKSCC